MQSTELNDDNGNNNNDVQALLDFQLNYVSN